MPNILKIFKYIKIIVIKISKTWSFNIYRTKKSKIFALSCCKWHATRLDSYKEPRRVNLGNRDNETINCNVTHYIVKDLLKYKAVRTSNWLANCLSMMKIIILTSWKTTGLIVNGIIVNLVLLNWLDWTSLVKLNSTKYFLWTTHSKLKLNLWKSHLKGKYKTRSSNKSAIV